MLTTIAGWDLAFEHWLDTGRSPTLVTFFSWVTHFGDPRVIAVVAIAIAVVLFRHRLWRYKAGFALALFGSIATSYIIKILVARERPLPPFPIFDAPGFSFPSMHAAASLATYGFLAYMAWKLMRPSHLRLPSALALTALPVLIGFSRVYLGVHFPSDVLGGWIVGALLLFLGTRFTERYNR